ncbi:hypothetical protein M436DRAFT_67263 [Aureobasidium namibiae CBS 147.97]|uniref:F-box domain-containing protein n=1 Tax=Aureobasidium namibiae CBS 147.97 TaxID=1043004 RepID=A0A074W9S6_9PEZI
MDPSNTKTSLETEGANERPHNAISFLHLPRELREMVYKHIPHNSGVTTYDTKLERKKPNWLSKGKESHPTGSLEFENKYGNSGVAFGSDEHCFAILSTCRTVHAEAMPIMFAATPLGFWRPMFSAYKYPAFLEKAFSSLPMHASKHIRVMQLQGELWDNNMVRLLNMAVARLPDLRTLQVCLDIPYGNSHARRQQWFDDPAIQQYSWPVVSTLHLVAQRLSSISITISPPCDMVWINASGWGRARDRRPKTPVTGAACQQFIWLQHQLWMLQYEVTIYGALVHGNAEEGRKFFENLQLRRLDLFQMGLNRLLVRSCIDGTVDFNLEDKKDGLRELTGRSFEVDEKEKSIIVFSGEDAEVKWCNFIYKLRPRGVAALPAPATLWSRIEGFTARWSGRSSDRVVLPRRD